MKTTLRILPLLLLASRLFAQDEPASPEALKEETGRIAVVHDAILKTVMIQVQKGDSFIPLGSGGIVSADGHIVTCAHVVEAASLVGVSEKDSFRIVLSDGKRHEAKLLAKNSKNDIALLKIDAAKLPHFDVSETRPGRNENVIALGYPAGNIGTAPHNGDDAAPHPSVALGHVTDPARKFMVGVGGESKYYPDSIENDAPVFMGNSGGPLINEKGDLIGLNAAISRNGRTFTLSVASISRCYDKLKEGSDVAGESPDESMSWDDYGSLLREMFDTSGGDGVEREYLHGPFGKMASARRLGVIALYRGSERVGYATVIDKNGTLVASLRTLEHKGLLTKIADEVGKGIPDDSPFRNLWDGARAILEKPLTAMLPSGKQVDVLVGRKSPRYGLAVLTVVLGNEKLEPIPTADGAGLEPGRWVAVLGNGEDPIAVGLLSAPKHTVQASQRVPLSLGDWVDAWSNDELTSTEYKDIILFDARLDARELGTPLCDGRGRMIGVTIFHPSRGTSYAAPIADVRTELGLK